MKGWFIGRNFMLWRDLLHVDTLSEGGLCGFLQGMTVVRIHLPMASLLCPHTSRLLTVFTGCPALKRLVYREPIQISREDFLHGNPLDEKTKSPLLQTLPVSPPGVPSLRVIALSVIAFSCSFGFNFLSIWV